MRRCWPPTLHIHGLENKVVGLWNSRDFTTALIKAGAKVCKLEMANIGHVGLVLAISRPLQWRAPVLGASIKFIEDMVSGTIHRSKPDC